MFIDTDMCDRLMLDGNSVGILELTRQTPQSLAPPFIILKDKLELPWRCVELTAFADDDTSIRHGEIALG